MDRSLRLIRYEVKFLVAVHNPETQRSGYSESFISFTTHVPRRGVIHETAFLAALIIALPVTSPDLGLSNLMSD